MNTTGALNSAQLDPLLEKILAFAEQKNEENTKFTVKGLMTEIRSDRDSAISSSADSLVRRCLSELVDNGCLDYEPGAGRRPSYYFLKQHEATQESSSFMDQREHEPPGSDIPVTVSDKETPEDDFPNTVADNGSSPDINSSPERENEKLPGSKPPPFVEILQLALKKIAALEERVAALENQSPTHLEPYFENLLEEFDRPAK